MKLNEHSLSFYATSDSPADNTGFLHKKGERNTAYHRRWFVLKGNMLFYFEDRESREPVGVIILEGCTVELCEAAAEFAFAIQFPCPKSRTYILAAESQAAMEGWVKALSRASFGYLRLVVKELEKQLEETQRNAAGGGRVQRRAPLCRKNKTAPNLELAASDLARPPEKPALLGGPPLKENSCALWNNTEAPPGNASWGAKSCDGEFKPPPLPPRRRSLPGYSGISLPSTGPPSALCFSRLHDWYGKEVLELQKAWLEGQKASRH